MAEDQSKIHSVVTKLPGGPFPMYSAIFARVDILDVLGDVHGAASTDETEALLAVDHGGFHTVPTALE